MIVWFSQEELNDYKRIAALRNDPKIAAGIHTNKFSLRHGDLEINILGVHGEAAVSEILGVDFDRRALMEGDGNIADLWYKGRSVQVKMITHKSGDLFFNSLSDFRADIAVLVVPCSANSVNVVGGISRKKFAKLCGTKNFGYGDRVTVPQNLLTPLEAIKRHLDSVGDLA